MNMGELGRIAADERMIPGAPVHASRTVSVDAPVDTVWAVLTDVPRWASWHAELRGAKMVGPFAAGASLSYGGLFQHKLAVAKVRGRDLVMLYGKLMGYSGVTRWELEAVPESRTNVTFTESSDGFLIAPLYGSARLGEHLDRWLEKLKAQAERR